jgi:hypothetical protein
MPTDDLSSLSELDDRQRAVLTEKLGLTSFYELILIDRQRVVEAFGRKSFRPTLEEVAVWQDQARRQRAAAAAAADWEQVASFVVVFEQRLAADRAEHRVQVEQTEVEPEAPPKDWPSWDCGNVCGWMLERLGLSEAGANGAAPEAASHIPQTPAQMPAPSRPHLRIERVTLLDDNGETDLVTGGAIVGEKRADSVLPAQLVVALGESGRANTVSVAVRLRRPGYKSLSVAGQLETTGSTVAIDLPELAPGPYEATVAAWAPDGSCHPDLTTLPTVFAGAPVNPGPGSQGQVPNQRATTLA